MSAPDRNAAILATAQLLRVAQAYGLDNQLVKSAVTHLLEVVNALRDEGPFVVADVVGAFFVNKGLVRLAPTTNEAAGILRKIYQRMRVHEFSVALEATEADVFSFLASFKQHWLTPTPWQIRDEPTGLVRLRYVANAASDSLSSGGGVTIDPRQNVLRTYARVAVLMHEVVEHSKAGQPFRSAMLRKAVQQLHDSSVGYESLLAGLTRFANFRGALHHHLTAVGALSLIMGRRMGLNKSLLLDLVLAALFHDLGRAAYDEPAMSTDLAAREALGFRVPALSMLANADTLTTESLGQAIVAFEQSLPARHRDLWAPGAMARIISVASFYDLITSDHPPRRGVAPDQAVRIIHEQSGARFDPLVVKLFTSAVGVYPVGTTVKLSTGELAIIVEVPADPARFTKPVVKIIRDERGTVDILVDLASDPLARTIARSVDASEVTVNPASFLLA